LGLLGCRNAGFGLSFPLFLFPDRFRVKPYPSKQKKGGWKFAPKGLGAWACLLGKSGTCLEILDTRSLAIPECREPFSMLPRHALSIIMVWNAVHDKSLKLFFSNVLNRTFIKRVRLF